MAWGGIHSRLAFVGVEKKNFWFLSHTFGSRYASKPIKGSKGLDDSLDSEKWSVGYVPRAR